MPRQFIVEKNGKKFIVEAGAPENVPGMEKLGGQPPQAGGPPQIPGLNAPGMIGQDPSKPGIDLSGLDTSEQEVGKRITHGMLGGLTGGPMGAALGAISPPENLGEAAQTYGTFGAGKLLPGAGTLATILKGAATTPMMDTAKEIINTGQTPSSTRLGTDAVVGGVIPGLTQMLFGGPAKNAAVKMLTQRQGEAQRELQRLTQEHSDAVASTSKATAEKFQLVTQKAAQQKNVSEIANQLKNYAGSIPEDKVNRVSDFLHTASRGGATATATYLLFHHNPAALGAAAAAGGVAVAWPKLIEGLVKDKDFGTQLGKWMENGAKSDMLKTYPMLQKWFLENATPLS